MSEDHQRRPATLAILVAATGLSAFALVHFEALPVVVILLGIGWIGGFALARMAM